MNSTDFDNLCTKQLCDCCEEIKKCDYVHSFDTTLKYLSFDITAKSQFASVDCIRFSQYNYFVLIELKNKRPRNIESDNIDKKLTATLQYLKKNYAELLKINAKFYLSIGPSKNEDSYSKIADAVALCECGMFDNVNYTLKDGTYSFPSKIIKCKDTERFCK